MRTMLFILALAISLSVGAQTPDQLQKIAQIEQLLTELAASCTGGAVPIPQPEPPTNTQKPWECYLARYDDVRNAGRYTEDWAWRHYQNWGMRERRCWFCDGDFRQEAWCRPEIGSGVGATKVVGSGFIWKPISETDGKLVVLMPASFPVQTVRVGNETGDYIGRHNGNKPHYRFDKPGGSYPDGIRLEAGDDEWCVNGPGDRHENSLWECVE